MRKAVHVAFACCLRAIHGLPSSSASRPSPIPPANTDARHSLLSREGGTRAGYVIALTSTRL